MEKAEFNYNGSNHIVLTNYKDDHIFKTIRATSTFYELKLLQKLESLNIKGNYIDIGANIGNHTLFFSKHTLCEQVYSFEISKEIYDILDKNVKENNLNNVTQYNIGLSNKEKMVSLTDIRENNIGCTKINGLDGEVKVDTLDNMNIDNIGLIKIDVEGEEENVIIGAMNCLNKYKPVIIAELHSKDLFNSFFDKIKGLGYMCDNISYASSPTYFFTVS